MSTKKPDEVVAKPAAKKTKKAAKPEEKTGFCRAVWARYQVALNHEITLEELQAAYDKAAYPKDQRPKSINLIHQSRSQLRKHWKLDDLNKFPIKIDGNVNIRKLVWMFLDMYGVEETNWEDAYKFAALDGIDVPKSNYSNSRVKYLELRDAENAPDSPDDNQDAGPRDGKPVKRSYVRRGKGRGKDLKPRKVVEKTTVQRYEKLEEKLDAILREAEELGNDKIMGDIKQARRRAGAFIVRHESKVED